VRSASGTPLCRAHRRDGAQLGRANRVETASLRHAQSGPSLEQVAVGQLAGKRTLGAQLGQALLCLVELTLAHLDPLQELLFAE